jgi:prolyl-tRNA editing enzyme YbaK/EbsC (Cys-tRNA(Pro) deacylase)
MNGVLEKSAVKRVIAAMQNYEIKGQIKVLSIITSGRHRVDTDLVASNLEVEKLERVDADYVKEKSGFSIGGVSPIGWLNPPSIVLIDEALNDYSVVWAAAGHPHAVFPTSFNELKSALAAKVMKVGD